MAWTASQETRSIFVSGLKNAHAMEHQALSIMKPQAERLQSYPDMEQRLRAHIQETETQIQRLDSIFADLGEDKSSLKDAALWVAGTMAALGHTIAPDEVLKNTFANFAFENFEVAAYKSLIALAEAGGLSTAVPLLEKSLDEELAMAQWIEEHIEPTTLQYVTLREVGLQAKR
jgi:ferritin-like metal-binding protein YciE